MKNLCIFYNDYDGVFEKRPFSNKYTERSYSIFSSIGKEYGFNVIISKYSWLSNEKVKGWTYNKKWTKVNNVKIDVIFNRLIGINMRNFIKNQRLRKKLVKKFLMINHPFIMEISNDKYMTYKKFGRFMPKTFLSSVSKDNIIKNIKSNKVFLKPRFGAGGKYIKVINKNNIKSLKKNYIVQEFIDTKFGIKGIINCMHDFRLVILDGNIIDCYIRQPTKGFISNISMGGNFIRSSKRIPKEIIRISRTVDKEFRKYKTRFYSIDFFIDKKDNPYIIELNQCPGFRLYSQVKIRNHTKIFRGICKKLFSSIKDSMY